jgi:hypothetical protein
VCRATSSRSPACRRELSSAWFMVAARHARRRWWKNWSPPDQVCSTNGPSVSSRHASNSAVSTTGSAIPENAVAGHRSRAQGGGRTPRKLQVGPRELQRVATERGAKRERPVSTADALQRSVETVVVHTVQDGTANAKVRCPAAGSEQVDRGCADGGEGACQLESQQGTHAVAIEGDGSVGEPGQRG